MRHRFTIFPEGALEVYLSWRRLGQSQVVRHLIPTDFSEGAFVRAGQMPNIHVQKVYSLLFLLFFLDFVFLAALGLHLK